MNAFGASAEHVVLSAVPGALGARDAIDRGMAVRFPGSDEAPSLAGRPGLARYRQLARYMTGFDLVLSYNWGSMDGVMAHRLHARGMGLPPLVHHEDGFNADELARQKRSRILFRRLALGSAYRTVVPSARLERGDIAGGDRRVHARRAADPHLGHAIERSAVVAELHQDVGTRRYRCADLSRSRSSRRDRPRAE